MSGGEESIMEKIYGRHRRSSSSSSSSSSDDEGKKKKHKNKPEAAHVPPEVVPEPEMSAADPPPGDEKDIHRDHHDHEHHHSSSSSSKNKIYRLFGRERPIHKVLGGGKPADVFLWRNKKVSGNVLGVATIIWFLFELLEYHLLTLACHVLILTLAVFYVWSNASSFINKDPPNIPDVHIPEKTLIQLASVLTVEINRGLAVLRSIASGKDLKKFFAVIAGLWFMSVIGGCFRFLTLVYLMFVLLLTLPMLYEKYEDQVDTMAEIAIKELKKQYAAVDAKVLSKMPSMKEKKF